MKKNVKYLGAAAAALLAVAPVVASTTVANAASIQVVGQGQAATRGNIVLGLKATNVASLKDGANADSVTADLSATVDGKAATAKVFGNGKAYVVPKDYVVNGKSEAQVAKDSIKVLKAGEVYKLVVPQVGVTGLNSKGSYTYNGKALTDEQNKSIADWGNVDLGAVESATFTIAKGNTYFLDGTTVVENGQTVDFKMSSNNVKTLAANIASQVKPVNTNNTLVGTSDLEGQIKAALAQAGVAVDKNGNFTTPVTNFTVPYTANYINGSSATITINVVINPNSVNAYSANGPQFSLNSKAPKGLKPATDSNGKVIPGSFEYHIAQNSNFDANSVLNSFDVAYSTGKPKEVLTNAKVVSNNVNTTTPGTYQVVLSATNPEGVTNKVVVSVIVEPNGETSRDVTYAKGYYVYAWNVNGNRATMSSTRYPSGSTVKTTGAPVTVQGVEYYKLAGTSNLYIQKRYVDGSWKPAASHQTSSETKMSGVVRVTYNGRGKVRLLTGNGKYTNQYIGKNTSWKVFAKKTINGQTMYRLGNDSQWVPAKFVEFR